MEIFYDVKKVRFWKNQIIFRFVELKDNIDSLRIIQIKLKIFLTKVISRKI